MTTEPLGYAEPVLSFYLVLDLMLRLFSINILINNRILKIKKQIISIGNNNEFPPFNLPFHCIFLKS